MSVALYNVVIGCPGGVRRNGRVEGRPRELAAFYAALLGMRIVRDDWLKIARDPASTPQLAFGRDGWSDERPPRWPDPGYPQQVHLDIGVRDLDAAEAQVLGGGATRLQDRGGYRSYADPVGHPFCLYPTGDATDGPGALERIVVDCAEPRALADFYAALLDMSRRVEDTSERVVVAHEDGRRPRLAFQRSDAAPPRWPDPAYPAQLHLDFLIDGAADRAEAERLGARRLPALADTCPVYADPAGHPFCLCLPGQ